MLLDVCNFLAWNHLVFSFFLLGRLGLGKVLAVAVEEVEAVAEVEGVAEDLATLGRKLWVTCLATHTSRMMGDQKQQRHR